MKTQLLQSCQGREAPPQPSPKGGRSCQPSKTQQEWTPAPCGGQGRGFRIAGLGPFKAAVFVPAPAGLFLPPTAAFFTVVTAGVMQCMTAVLVPMPRRKTCFPTGIRDSTAKAKPPAVATAFCVYFIPCGDEQINAHSGRPVSSNSVGVALSRRRYPQQDSGLKCIGGILLYSL